MRYVDTVLRALLSGANLTVGEAARPSARSCRGPGHFREQDPSKGAALMRVRAAFHLHQGFGQPLGEGGVGGLVESARRTTNIHDRH